MKLWFLIFLFLSHSAGAVSPEVVERNNQGVKDFQEDKAYEAYKKFNASLAEEPFHPFIHMNLGMTFLKNKESEKAEKAFAAAVEIARAQNDSEGLFYTLFNLAALQSTTGKTPEALKNYQEALSLRPGDMDVRENIEKIWKAKQQKGGGQGQDKQEKDEPKDDEKDQDKKKDGEDDKKQDDQGQKKKPKPKPFKSKELSKDNVRKILEEIKNQEQKIRAKIYEGKVKERPRAKDW